MSMKKIFIALLLFPFILNAQQKYERIFYKLSDDIEFKIISYSKSKTMDVGSTGMDWSSDVCSSDQIGRAPG